MGRGWGWEAVYGTERETDLVRKRFLQIHRIARDFHEIHTDLHPACPLYAEQDVLPLVRCVELELRIKDRESLGQPDTVS